MGNERAWTRALEDAGLAVKVERTTCTATADSYGVTVVTPTVGQVIPQAAP
jgi:hypothetical protein